MMDFGGGDGPKGWIGQQTADQLRMQRMTRFVRLDMREQRKACQGEVADEIERFVAAEFVREAQRAVHYAIRSEDDGVVQGTAGNQYHRGQRLTIPLKTTGARTGHQ